MVSREGFEPSIPSRVPGPQPGESTNFLHRDTPNTRWCRRGDSNPHAKGTCLSDMRVCQFHHPGPYHTSGAAGEIRTPTGHITHHILSVACLPVPAPLLHSHGGRIPHPTPYDVPQLIPSPSPRGGQNDNSTLRSSIVVTQGLPLCRTRSTIRATFMACLEGGASSRLGGSLQIRRYAHR